MEISRVKVGEVMLVEVAVKLYENAVPTLPEAVSELVKDAKVQDPPPPPPPAATTLITTESVSVVVPSVHEIARVIEPPTVGYQVCAGSIVPEPLRAIPEAEGRVKEQEVAFEDVQAYV